MMAKSKRNRKKLPIGDRILSEIVKQGMMHVESVFANKRGKRVLAGHVITWSGNAAEQLEAVVLDWAEGH